MSATKAHVLAFLKNHIHAVISTATLTGQPEAALIGFGETEQLELIMGTFKTSRKYRNLKTNNRAAFVIGWGEDNITVQYEGLATELNPDEWEPFLTLYHAKVPGAAMFKSKPDQTYFKITPTWIRYSDLSGNQPEITELTFS